MQTWPDDLRLARQIQEALLGDSPPALPGVRLAGATLPALSLGGDYYDFLARDGRVRVIIADVMGKGAGAAMQMMMARTAVRLASTECPSPGQLLQRVNSLLYPDLRRLGSFLTMFCAEFNPDDGSLWCANAGHPPPLVQRATAVETVRVRGIAVGAIPHAQYEEVTLALQPRDTVLFFTDGTVEALSARRQMRTEELVSLLHLHRGATAEQIYQRLVADLAVRIRAAPQRDDITLALLQADPLARMMPV